ncbi:hypothetical protein G9A89_010266 [Geosiphon pyriformis]|nr:hypothetical protein G9A89_010266 [Geosiphon pyriformis]
MIRKSLRAKAGLPCDFSSKILYYFFLYELKPFEQVQSEKKLVLLILFSNSCGILRHLFDHRFLDLQVLGWSPLNSLQFPVKLCVSSVNNFLAEVVKIFLENELSLSNNLPCAFCGSGDFSMFSILDQSLYYKSIFSLKHFGVVFVLEVIGPEEPSATATEEDVLSVLDFDRFFEIRNSLLEVWSNCIKVYTDEFLRCAGFVGTAGGAAVYFLAANMSIRVKVAGLLFSTLAKLQAVVLALKCVLSSCLVVLYLDSQSVINVCMSEASSITSDFHNQYVLGNIRADTLANKATFLFLVAEKTAISGNVYHFAQDLHWLICCAFSNIMIKEIDWNATVTVWYLDSHMLFGFTSRKLVNLHMYLIKAIYRQLLVVVRKRLYSRSYLGVLCLLCGDIEFSDHVFTCSGDSDVGLYTAVCKGFVIKDWYAKATIKTKHRVEIEKAGLVEDNNMVSGLSNNVVSTLLAGVVYMLGVIESFAVKFGRHKLCHFFSGLSSDAFVAINV